MFGKRSSLSIFRSLRNFSVKVHNPNGTKRVLVTKDLPGNCLFLFKFNLF
jgi:hypothetical protein